MKILNIVGARPIFMIMVLITKEMNKLFLKKTEYLLVHTGQHYDDKMNKSFFKDLRIPKPDVNLAVGSGSCGG